MTPDELYEIKVRANYADDAAFDGGQKYIDAAMKSSMDVRALLNEVERLREIVGEADMSRHIQAKAAHVWVRARDKAGRPVPQEMRDLAEEAEL